MTTPRRLALTALLVCCSTPACNKLKSSLTGSSAAPAASAPAAAAGTKFTIRVPAKGTTQVSDVNTTLQFSMAAMGAGRVLKKLDMKQVDHDKTTQKVLAANDKGPTSVQVTYNQRVENDSKGGKTSPDKSPVQGKTYIATLKKGGKIVVTTPDGKPVKKAEAKIVRQDQSDLGKTDPFTKLLPNHPLEKGEQLKVTKDLASKLLGAEDMKTDVDKVSFTFQGTKQDGARTEGLFELKMQVTGYPDPTTGLQMKIHGTVAIDTATGWPISMHIVGPIQIKGGDMKHQVQLQGQGKMQMDGTYTYQ